MKIDFQKIKDLRGSKAKEEYCTGLVSAMTQRDVCSLSEVLANLDVGGGPVCVALSNDERMKRDMESPTLKWKLFARCDDWGTPYAPGDSVKYTTPKNMKDSKFHPVGASVINAAITDGSFSERFQNVKEFKVDSKGCIEVPYTVAMFFLKHYGYVYGRKVGLCNKREIAKDPARSPDGTMKHIWHWRFAEINDQTYATLPDLARKKTKDPAPAPATDPAKE